MGHKSTSGKKKTTVLKKLKRIADTTYCQLRQSPIQGVGIFAIRDIPQGIAPLEDKMMGREKFYRIAKNDLKGMPDYFENLVKNFSVQEGEYYWISLGSWNTYALQDFLNHSERPNVDLCSDDTFVTLRKIKKGEELTADYRTFDASWREKLRDNDR